jgi:hypothetical protein
MNRGKIIILSILTAAIGISGYGVWYRHQQMHRVLDALSPRVAQLIAYAAHVELLELSAAGDPVAEPDKTISVQSKKRSIAARKVVGESKGFSNLRADLVRDSSYDWNKPKAKPQDNDVATWQYVIVFNDGSDEARLAFDTEHCHVLLLESGPALSISPICEATTAFFLEQFPKDDDRNRKAE